MAASMFDRYGGFATVRKIVLDFYDKMLDSPSLSGHFANTEMARLIDHQTKFIAYVMGGPASYTNEQLKKAHVGLRISEKDFSEMSALLEETLEDHGMSAEDVDQVINDVAERQGFVVTSQT